MIINAKCSFDKKQLNTSLSKGLSGMEFHTEWKDFDGSIDFSEIRDILDYNDVVCNVVHTPYRNESGDSVNVALGTLYSELRKDNMDIYKKTIDAASILCKSKNPIIVTHIGTMFNLSDKEKNNLSEIEIERFLGEAKEDLMELNSYVVENYPNIKIVVENVPSYCYASNHDIISAYFGTNVDLAKFIRELNLSNVGTCLDVCHALTTIKVNKMNNPYSCDSIQEYIKEYASTLGLIHLNKPIGLGEISSLHSQPFLPDKEDDVKFLVDFLKSLDAYDVKCPITLEINDTDYTTQKNVDLMISALNEAANTVGKNIIKQTKIL